MEKVSKIESRSRAESLLGGRLVGFAVTFDVKQRAVALASAE
jgi:hypothetical protein